LGLRHSRDKSAIMFPVYHKKHQFSKNHQNDELMLSEDDTRGIRYIYAGDKTQDSHPDGQFDAHDEAVMVEHALNDSPVIRKKIDFEEELR